MSVISKIGPKPLEERAHSENELKWEPLED